MQARELVGQSEGPDGRLEADALEGHRQLASDGGAGARVEASKAKKPSGRPCRTKGRTARQRGRRPPADGRPGSGASRCGTRRATRRPPALPAGAPATTRPGLRPRARRARGTRASHRGAGHARRARPGSPLRPARTAGDGEGADEVHLPGVVEAAAGVLPVGALAQGDAGQVKQVLGSLKGGRSQQVTHRASQAGERRVPALGAVASGLDALKELQSAASKARGEPWVTLCVSPTSRRRHRSATASGDSLDRARSRAPSMAAVVSSAAHPPGLGRAAGHVRIPVEAAAGPPANEPGGHSHHVHGCAATDAVEEDLDYPGRPRRADS